MIRTSQIPNGKRRVHPLRQYIPIKLFISEHVFLTEDLQVGMTLRISGLDYECRDEASIEAQVARLVRAFSSLGQEYRVYQYLHRARGCSVPHQADYGHAFVTKAVQERVAHVQTQDTLECWMVILSTAFRKPMTLVEKVKRLATTFLSQKLAADDIEDAAYRFAKVIIEDVTRFCAELSDMGITVALAGSAFPLLQKQLNFDGDVQAARPFRSGYPVDQQMSGTGIEIKRNSLRVGDWHVRLLTLHIPPRFTHANMLRLLTEARAQFIAVTEYEQQANSLIKAAIQSKINQVNTSKFEFLAAGMKALGNLLETSEDRSTADLDRQTRSMVDSVNILGEAESQLDNYGKSYGRFSFSLLLYDENEQALNASLSRLYHALANLDMVMHAETFGLFRQYIALIPGNQRFQFRSCTFSNDNRGDTTWLHLPQRGSFQNKVWNGEYSLALQSRQGTPVFINLGFGEDAGNVFVCGMNGSGKSFLMNLFLVHLMKYGRIILLIIDVGGSYRKIVQTFGGTYVDVDVERMQFTINPFCLPPTAVNKHFIKKFVQGLMETDDSFRLNDADLKDLYRQIGSVYEAAPQDRRLSTLYMLLKANLRMHLSRWVQEDEHGRSGEYGWVFDNAEDTLTLSEFQCFDFSLMEDLPDIAEHMMLYINQRHRSRVRDKSLALIPKVLHIDEAHRFVKQETSRKAILLTAKQGRKDKSYVFLCTQAPEDLGDIARVLAEVGTFVALHNPNADMALYRDRMGFADIEVEHVRTLTPKRDLMVKHPGQPAQIAEFHATAWEQGMYSSTPQNEGKVQSHEVTVIDRGRSKPVVRRRPKRKDGPARVGAQHGTSVGAGD